MSMPLKFDAAPDQAGLEPSPSRSSLVATLRRKTSTIFRRNPITMTAITASTAENTSQPTQPIQAESEKSKRGWFHSVGSRFHRQDHAAPESSESSQDEIEMEESAGTANSQSSPETSPSPSPETSPSPPPGRRRLFSSRRLRLHSLPARFRRRRTALFSRSSSLSNEDKENSPSLTAPRPVNASNTGSWSSFRSGVQRAVREMVDGNFRFSDDHDVWNASPRPHARVPLRTLWTIMSADSSEGQSSQRMPPPTPPRKYQLCSPTWSPDWSPTSPTYVVISPSDSGSGASDEGLTHSGSTPDSSSVSTVQSPAASEGSRRESVQVLEDLADEETLTGVFGEEVENGSVRGVEMVGREREREDGGERVGVRRRDVTPLVAGHPAGGI